MAPAIVNPTHDLLAPVPGQVEVDIRHLAEAGPLGIQKTVARQVEAERAGMTDAEGITAQRIRGRPAASVAIPWPRQYSRSRGRRGSTRQVDLLDHRQLAFEPGEGLVERGRRPPMPC
jgi:hypothetical protein